MCRKIKEFIEIEDHASLDALIGRLTAIRAALPPEAEPKLSLKGDDVFGRAIGISYFRLQTADEATCDARYAACRRPAGRVVRRMSLQIASPSAAGLRFVA